MNDTVIQVENLSKLYYIGHLRKARESLGKAMLSAATMPLRRSWQLLSGHAAATSDLDEPLWALKDVSFEVKQGDVLAIIGGNGAGKSTLLKILSRIVEPTAGRAVIRGRIGSLLEVGTGFHPDLTGRENVYLNGSMLGMKKNEIDRKFDEVVAFSEIEKFIDTPVKHYSSGMYTRLAFAVAAFLEPEILILDEVLAVGDYTFQQKCLEKMETLARSGRTILFVSHSMAPVRRLCTRGLILNKGRIVAMGSAVECIDQYLQRVEQTRPTGFTDTIHTQEPGVAITAVLVNGAVTDRAYLGPQMDCLEVAFRGRLDMRVRFDIEAGIQDPAGNLLGFFSPAHELGTVPEFGPGPFEIRRRIRLPRMLHGDYYLSLSLCDPNQRCWVNCPRLVRLVVEGPPVRTGTTFNYHEKGWVLLPSAEENGLNNPAATGTF